MKRLHNLKSNPWILYDVTHVVECCDDWRDNKYTMTYNVYLLWYGWFKFRWMICTGDFTMQDKRLSVCALFALRHMEKDAPRYYRLKEHMMKNLDTSRLS